MWANLTISPHQQHHAFVEPAKTFQALLTVVRASIPFGQHWKIEQAFAVPQINAVFGKIGFAFRSVGRK